VRIGRGVLLGRSLQVAAIAVVGVVLVTVFAPESTTTSYEPSGEPMSLPNEQLAPVDPEQFGRILVGLSGTPVVVNIWASWCGPCRAEMPLLEQASTDYEDRVTFVGLASKDDRSSARTFLADVGVTYPNLFDHSGEVRSELGLRGFPTTYVFDGAGEMRDAIVGGVSEQQLAALLDDVLR
jgi:thiol-disulfide isomerase/thioredoxin